LHLPLRNSTGKVVVPAQHITHTMHMRQLLRAWAVVETPTSQSMNVITSVTATRRQLFSTALAYSQANHQRSGC
jgi:hypothetical protein